MGTPVVIDLSHWNPTPDWKRIAAAGVIGVIHKATEATTYVDDKLFSRAVTAIDSGLCWATYHFMRPGNITKQMDHYLATVDPVLGERLCLDHEDPGVPLADLVAAFEYLMEKRPDLQLTVYSGHLLKEQLGNSRNEFLAKHTSLWIAHYTGASAPTWPAGTWPAWSLWQYTDRATVDGISEPVDGNRWNGSEAALFDWFGPSTQEPPEPEPVRKTVLVNIQADPGIDVQVHVNGELVT